MAPWKVHVPRCVMGSVPASDIGPRTVGPDRGLPSPRVWPVRRESPLRPVPDRGVSCPTPGLPNRLRNSSQVRGQPEANVGGLLITVSEAWRVRVSQGGITGAPQGQAHPCCRKCLFSAHCEFQIEGGYVGMGVGRK